MKKLLITTSALAIAGSAFAADTSGYAIMAYETKDTDGTKSAYIRNETEAYVSGSKTTANGLTFGATLTLGMDGMNAAKTTTPYTHINSYVSGAFGKVAVGRLSSAGRSIGGVSLAVGNDAWGTTSHGIARNRTDKGTLVFTSPTFSGVTVAYSTDFGHVYNTADKTAKSLAAKYVGEFSGVAVAGAFNMDTVLESEVGKDTKSDQKSMGVKVGYMGANFSYTTSDKKNVLENSAEPDSAATWKETRLGLDYTVSDVKLGYSQLKKDNDMDSDTTNTTLIVAEYMVAEGLTVFVSNKNAKTEGSTESEDKVMSVGTNISF